MTTKEVMQSMLDGKKVRDIKWSNPHEYIYISDGQIVCEKGTILRNFGISGNWEIYEEPKPKQTVTIEKWLAESAFEGYLIIEGTKEYIQDFSQAKVKLLSTYEVEL